MNDYYSWKCQNDGYDTERTKFKGKSKTKKDKKNRKERQAAIRKKRSAQQ